MKSDKSREFTPDKLENLRTVYNQLCTSYHNVDDFRAKLLGLLPIASGAAIFGLVHEPTNEIQNYLFQIGLFGVFITFGLLVYELKGIQKCIGFIEEGIKIERKLIGEHPEEIGKIFKIGKAC